jgi:hypothetical protein
VDSRAGTIYLRASLKWMAGLYGFFFLSGCVVAGAVQLKWWGVGGGGKSVFLLSLVCCQFSRRLDVCGRIFVLHSSIFFGEFVVLSCGFVCKLLIFDNLLQVVSAQSELGGGPGTSA